LPEGCDLWTEFWREQFRVKNAAVEVDACAGGIATSSSLLGRESGLPEIVVNIVCADPRFGDAQLSNAPSRMEFEPVIPVLGELDGMLRGVGRNGDRFLKVGPTAWRIWSRAKELGGKTLRHRCKAANQSCP
jgi:hypothetical protein